MPDLSAELFGVNHLASLTTMNATNIQDAKIALGPVERGLDVVFELDGRIIGAQSTIFHADEGRDETKRGSPARATEEATARRTQVPYGVWSIADYRPALKLRLEEKCKIATRHDNQDVVDATWLVVSACLPRWGAAASTVIMPEVVKIGELNQLFHDLLSASSFERVYLVMHMSSVVFEWNRRNGWSVAADLDAGERELHKVQMNDLINMARDHHRDTTASW